MLMTTGGLQGLGGGSGRKLTEDEIIRAGAATRSAAGDLVCTDAIRSLPAPVSTNWATPDLPETFAERCRGWMSELSTDNLRSDGTLMTYEEQRDRTVDAENAKYIDWQTNPLYLPIKLAGAAAFLPVGLAEKAITGKTSLLTPVLSILLIGVGLIYWVLPSGGKR